MRAERAEKQEVESSVRTRSQGKSPPSTLQPSQNASFSISCPRTAKSLIGCGGGPAGGGGRCGGGEGGGSSGGDGL